jgi:hypothetical protein
MTMEGNIKQDLWQFDVTVVKKGYFTIYAHDLEEAERIANDTDLDTRLICWTDAEVTGVD